MLSHVSFLGMVIERTIWTYDILIENEKYFSQSKMIHQKARNDLCETANGKMPFNSKISLRENEKFQKLAIPVYTTELEISVNTEKLNPM